MDEVIVKVPARLVSTGAGRVAFSLEIVENKYRGKWSRTWRVGNIAHGELSHAATSQITFDGDVGGEVVVELEFLDEHSGKRLVGAFSRPVDRRETSSQNVVVGNQHSEGSGVIYQPIEVRGAEAKNVQLVGDKASITVPLEEERLGASVALDDLLEREEFIVLPGVPGRPVRVFQLRIDKNLVLGRCYANQLGGKALEVLQKLVNPPRVHWVTNWDDDRVNRISALMGLSSKGGQDALVIRNITDYSRRGTPLVVVCDDDPEAIVEPGEDQHIELENEREIRVCVGEGTARRTLVRLVYQEAILETASGPVPIPVLQTVGTSFCFPPEGGDDSTQIRFLGVWVGVTPRRLRELLQDDRDNLYVDFRQDDFRLRLSQDHRAVVVFSNVDLRACMAG